MNTNTAAGTTGYVLGIAYARARQINSLIDWQEVAQIVLHGLVTIAVMTYLAGYALGTALHTANDRLAAFWARLWASEPEVLAAPTTEPIQPVPAAAPVVNALAVLATELEQLTCKQLRAITGCRSKLPKAQLVALALAC